MKFVEHLKTIFSRDTTPNQMTRSQREVDFQVDALIIDDSEAFAKFLAKRIGTTITPLIVKDSTIEETLNSINIHSKGAKAVFISSHLMLRGSNLRHQLGGIELVKHIRLTEWLTEVSCLPLIIFGWDDIVSYLRVQIDNIILLAPGCRYVQLPVTTDALQTAFQQTGQFNSFSEMRVATRDYFPLTPSERAASSHDYRNKVGVGKLWQEFVPISDPPADPFKKSQGNAFQSQLWLKKLHFVTSQTQYPFGKEPVLESDLRLKEMTSGKKFIYIDDEHRAGWSYTLFSGLIREHLSEEFFQSPERSLITPDGRFTIIDAYDVAMPMILKKKTDFETRLQQWADADWKMGELIGSFRIARENVTAAGRLCEETAKQLMDAEKNVKACELSYLERTKSFREKTRVFAKTWADIETGSAEMPDIVIEDKKYQEGLETLNAARRDYVSARKLFESANDNLLKLKNDQAQYQQRLEAARAQFGQVKHEHDNAKVTFENADLGLDDLFPWSLIFLDLRLVQPDDENKPIESIGGVQILNEVKSFDPSIPLIIFTASEKALSYETCMRLGADAYWMKGISSGQQLWRYIEDCLESTYLREIWLKIRKVDMKRELHCFLLRENGMLESRILTKDNLERKQIVKLLQDSFFLLRQKNNRFGQQSSAYDVHADVALNMGLIQEIRYREGGEGAKIDGKTWDKLIRGNEIPRDEQEVIRRLRNTAVHAFELRRSGDIRTSSVSQIDALKAFHFTLDRLLRNP